MRRYEISGGCSMSHSWSEILPVTCDGARFRTCTAVATANSQKACDMPALCIIAQAALS